jgi:septal ring factor EnvC (AmiA/AmiB activator)
MIRRISIVFLSFLVSSVIFSGCGGKDDNSEAAKAELLLPKVQKDLERVRRNYNSLSDQLRVVQHERDQLALQLRQLMAEGQNVDEMKAKIKQQTERITLLGEQIEELNVTVESQRATISEQQNTITELVGLIEQQPVSDTQQETVEPQAEGY